MQKSVVDTAVDPSALSMTSDPPSGCINYESCGNMAPELNDICPECLDDARKADRERR